MLQVAGRSLCDRAGESPAQGQSRTRQMVLSVLGSEPRDGLEFMLATLAFGHFELILDSMHDAFQCQEGVAKAKIKTSIVALDRSMLGMIKEFRLARRREAAFAEVARQEKTGSAATTTPATADKQTSASRPPLPPEAHALPPAVASVANGPAENTTPGQAVTPEANSLPLVAASILDRPMASNPADPEPAADLTQPHTAISVDGQGRASGAADPALSPWEDDGRPEEEQVFDYHTRLAAMFETIADARGREDATRDSAGSLTSDPS
jgi:hypothetical protein